MTTPTFPPTQNIEAEQQAPLQLFSVELDWNPSNDEEGTYASQVWAKDEDDAIRELATEMAEHSDSGCETQEARDKFIQRTIESADPYAAVRVSDEIVSGLTGLLKGPTGEMTDESQKDLDAIMGVLGKYGIREPNAQRSMAPGS